MDIFKKEEPVIHADTPQEASAPQVRNFTAPPMPVMPGSGGLTQMLERTLELEEENNRMLKHMQFMNRIGFWAKLLIWALILGLPVIFFQPLMQFVQSYLVEHAAMFGLPPEVLQKAAQTFQTGQAK